MASITLSAIGSAAFGPLGGLVGGLAGSMIDNRLFARNSRLPDAVGARLADTRVQVSSYGQTLPQAYGNVRLAGNVIWALPIKEVQVTSTTSVGGGKGGGGGKQTQTQITYEYYITLAIAICEGPINKVTRVWADSEALSASTLSAGKYEVHLGTEDQLPSSIIESHRGVGRTPAYRGVAYVVIEDMPLAKYGNRIPNFTFEIYRQTHTGNDMAEKIKAISIIPGSGEFVYSTQVTNKLRLVWALGPTFYQAAPALKLNMHNHENRANVLLALEQMQEALPNLEWVSVIINWFADSKHPDKLRIAPRVEFLQYIAETAPNLWHVGDYTRQTAPVVQEFADGTPTFGGTPADISVYQICARLKAMGYKVMLYPMLQVDTTEDMAGEENKPWRGRIVPSSTADVTRFFTGAGGEHYTRFIRHYSQLVVNGNPLRNVFDAFVIGSEMVGMTTFDSGDHSFPAVAAFKTLAAQVRSDLGAGKTILYAADWSEYHSINGWFHLDPLWADPNIDVVGIDCYFPLTEDLPQSQITSELIKQGWESGEGWDYYYLDSENRTGKTSYNGDPTYAWKNVEYWWSHTHTNPDSETTGWTPKMKPVWFTEYGFPSVDGAANQPNVFYDPRSADSRFPRRSKGRVDYRAQRQAIIASEEFFEQRNQESGNSGLVPWRFLWTWDARPYPYWPDMRDFWGDWAQYPTGHWIQGKVNNIGLGAIVADLLDESGIDASMYDVSELMDQVAGMVVIHQTSARSLLEQLQTAYFFDCIESEGMLKFRKRGNASIITIQEDELVPLSIDPRVSIEVTRLQELELPQAVDVNYMSRAANYDTNTQSSRRQVVDTRDRVTLNLPLVLEDGEAKNIADVNLYSAWASRTVYSFRLPPKYAFLEPADVVTLAVGGRSHVLRITSAVIERNGQLHCEGVADDASTYAFYFASSEGGISTQPGAVPSPTDMALLDVPALPQDTANEGVMRVAMAPFEVNWQGAILYGSNNGGEQGGNEWRQVAGLVMPAVMGHVLNLLEEGPRNYFDYANEISLVLLNGELVSVSELSLLNGVNTAVVGNEIIQFQEAELVADHQYILRKLLRGRFGTEHEMATHQPGDRFILLDNAIHGEPIPAEDFGLLRHYKPVSIGTTLAETEEQAFIYTGKTLRPWSPVHISGTRDGSGNLTISWIRRTRLNGNLRDFVNIPLSEEMELYEVDILNGSTVVRTITGIVTPEVAYSATQQTADFGAPQSAIMVRIYQISALFGRGVAGEGVV